MKDAETLSGVGLRSARPLWWTVFLVKERGPQISFVGKCPPFRVLTRLFCSKFIFIIAKHQGLGPV